MTLAQQYAAVSSVVLIGGMLIIGHWVAQEIEQKVTTTTAQATALYMDSFVAPLVWSLAHSDELPPSSRASLDRLLGTTAVGQRIVAFKIWKKGGYVAYSSNKSIIGKRFRPTKNLKEAWRGRVMAEFDNLVDEEDAVERARGIPLLEMYSPIRDYRTGRVIAIAEFYENGTKLKEAIFQAKSESWLVVGGVTLTMLLLLFGIVRRGSKTIVAQQNELEKQVVQLKELLKQNRALHRHVQYAYGRTAEINESFLRRIGAELHDGPGQLLGFVMLKLDTLEGLLARLSVDRRYYRSEIEDLRRVISDAIKELRQVAAGLALPELENLPLCGSLIKAVENHKNRTGTEVHTEIQNIWFDVPHALKICLYRFVAEGLNNAYRHAQGRGQVVRCAVDKDVVIVVVSDAGPGLPPESELKKKKDKASHSGLGLIGMRTRIESLGGRFDIRTAPGKGTHLIARFRIEPQVLAKSA